MTDCNVLAPVSTTVVVPMVSPAVAAEQAVPAPKVPLHRVNLDRFLVEQCGKFVGLTFTKVDGEVRHLNGRLGVRKHLKTGGPSTVAADSRPYVVLYDVKTEGYRAVNLATLSAVRASKRVHQVVG